MSRPADPVPAVLMTGMPASGKSVVGRGLASRIGAALLDQDTATGPLVAVVGDLLGTHDLDDPRLAAATRAARYETVLAVAEDCLRVGTPVVLVAPFTAERRDRAAWDLLAGRLRRAGGDPLLVWLRVSPATSLARLRRRGAARDEAKLADPAAYLAGADDAAPTAPHAMVDADAPLDAVVRAVAALVPARAPRT